jgi:TatD DNase family protein
VRDEKHPQGVVWEDFWSIYREYPVKGVLHSYTDSLENAELALKRGLYFGINGIVTYDDTSKKMRAMWRALPLERILLETDAPFLSPQALRKTHRLKNEPLYVKYVAEFLAKEIYQVSISEIDRATTRNAEQLFLKK